MPRKFSLENTRNIGIMAHIDAGKTTTTERILFYTGRTYKIGEVHEGRCRDGLDGAGAGARHHDHLRRDHLRVERHAHQHHRHAGPRRLHRRGRALAARARRCRGAFDSVAGVQPQSETVWRQADKYHVPRIAFVNKMDRVGADFENAVQTMIDRLGAHPVPIQLPIGAETELQGIIDLVENHAIIYKDDLGKEQETTEIPAELAAAAAAARERLLDDVSHYDDDLVELILEDREIR